MGISREYGISSPGLSTNQGVSSFSEIGVSYINTNVPSVFSNLVLWLDGTSFPTSEVSTLVDRWVDKSGNVDALQPDSDKQSDINETRLAGHNSVRCHEGEHLIVDESPSGDSPTVFVVFSQVAVVQGNEGVIGLQEGTEQFKLEYGAEHTGVLFRNSLGITNGTFVGSISPVGITLMTTVRLDSSDNTGIIREDGVLQDTTSDYTIHLGADSHTHIGKGYDATDSGEWIIGEVLVYARALSDSEIDKIELYLTEKWGIL